jgi:TerC family integral membrane protein
MSLEFWVLVGFHIFILSMLALDLGVFQRKAHVVHFKESAIWTGVWIGLALTFAVGIWQFWHLWSPERPDEGPAKAGLFLVGYGIELSMSVDNLFVFLVIFRYFAVPHHLQHRVLFWGILGALFMRAGFILAGVALLRQFEWLIFGFGALLLWTAFKMLRSVEAEIDPGRNPLLKLARRLFPVVDDYDMPHFWVKRNGRWHATPLPLVLLVVESTDLLFAIDSIPAIFGIFPTPHEADPFIVYTSNIFAILGLRSMFFLLSHFLGMFRYLTVGLALVLSFIGVKMLVHDWIEVPIAWSLGGIAVILTTSVIASIIAGPRPDQESPVAEVKERPLS